MDNEKIAIVVSYPYQKNPQLQKEVRALVEFGFDIEIITWDRSGERPPSENLEGVKITNVQQKGTSSIGGVTQAWLTFRFWSKAFFLLRKTDAFAIHCQDLNTVPPGLLASKMMKTPVIYDAHDPYPEMFMLSQPKFIVRIMQVLERFVSRQVDYIITVNQLMAERFRKMTNKPIQVVYNFPEKRLFRPPNSPKKSNKEELTIGRVGTIQPRTGIEEIVAVMQSKSLGNHLKLLLVGQVTPDFEEEFEKIIAPIADRVEMTGFVQPDQVPQFYERIDVSLIFYHPTPIFQYLSPMKLFESMAMGVPVVASDIGDVRSCVEKFDCGIVLKDGSISELQKAIEFMEKNPSERMRMRENGKHAVEEEINWETESQKMSAFYMNLTSL